MSGAEKAPAARAPRVRDAPAPPPEDTAAAVLLDADGLVTGWTSGARRLLGHRAEEVLGRAAHDLIAAPDTEEGPRPGHRHWKLGHRQIRSGRRTVRVRHRDGHALELTVRVSRLTGRSGRTGWLVAVADDRAAVERLALLSEAGTRIGTTLDVMRTAQELADFAVPRLADYASVDLVEAVSLGGEPLSRVGLDAGRVPAFRRAGVASVHEGIPEALWTCGAPVFVPPNSPFVRVLTLGRPYIEPVMDASTWGALDPQRGRLIADNGIHTVMIVPIQARGMTLGIGVFVRTDNPAPFEQDDLLLAEELVGRAALSLDNANRYTRERSTALALQRNLLPGALAGSDAVEIGCRYCPADLDHGVGGDWYDVIELPGDRLALVVGDVVGHGINAAATMGRLRTALRTLADMDLPPAELLTRLDHTVNRLAPHDREGTAAAMGATCVYAVYDPAGRRLEVARAGHPPPLLVSPAGRASFPEVPAGVPIGLGLPVFESAEFRIPDGTLIALCTDGLVESRAEDIDTGLGRLAALLSRPGASLDELASGAVAAMCRQARSDDATLLLARGRTARGRTDRPPPSR
ncbi:SpoIIE family protein phosphatase [Streptomyces sp. NPDC096198]|uniref:SpoIIE family protein phosphatase n=1 Tax=Streptomyces sp. NPDC096198 TaxID=3366080 RepID=UPI003808A2B0